MKPLLPVLADMRQLFPVAFIISLNSGLRRGGTLGKRALVRFFVVINLDDLDKDPS